MEKDERLKIARAMREACVRAAKDGYERAAISGLCAEGAFEAALSAIHMMDIDAVLRSLDDRQA